MADRPPRYKRWVHPFRDDPDLVAPFDRALGAIGRQIDDLQARHGCTVQQLANGTRLSKQGLLHIGKLQSDVKLSTMVRIFAFFGYEVVVSLRPIRAA